MTQSDDFDAIVPQEITSVATRSGGEWVIPLPQVVDAIRLATDHQIAVLGVESFRIQPEGFYALGFSGYEFSLDADWPSFVGQNNEAAVCYINEHQYGQGQGYILNAVSVREFAQLAKPIGLAQKQQTLIDRAKRILNRVGRGKPPVAGDEL